MSIKDKFTEDEWKNLLELPLAAGMALIFASPSGPIGLIQESRELAVSPSRTAAEGGSNELVNALAVELQSRMRDLIRAEHEKIRKTSPASYRAEALEDARSAASALSKASPEDAEAYRRWVEAISQKVAGAAKERGVPVSDEEKATLDEISAALATPAG